MMNIKEKVVQIREYLKGGPKKIVVLGHTNPDGDAIGSALAWAHVLRSQGHQTTSIVPNRYPSFLEWMPGIETMLIFKDHREKVAEAIKEADVIFCMDFNNIDRLEALGELIGANTHAKRILIDHHLNPPDIFDLQISQPTACSTAYIVYRVTELYSGLDVIDQDMAEALYVGIMTDTGNFSYSYLTPDLFRAVAVLVEKGVDIPKLNSLVYNSYVEGRVRLLGFVLLEKMKLIENGQVAYISLQENELRRFDFQLGDSEGFVNFPLSIANVKMSAMFLQTKNFIRVSLRSQGDVDVSLFASRYFDGGGHKNAAGGKSFDTMAKTIRRYEEAVSEFFEIQGLSDR